MKQFTLTGALDEQDFATLADAVQQIDARHPAGSLSILVGGMGMDQAEAERHVRRALPPAQGRQIAFRRQALP